MGQRIVDFDVPTLFRLWAEGVSEREICLELGIRHGSFYIVKDRHKLPPRARAAMPVGRGDDELPTPEEIAERAAAVRAAWSPEEEERRRVGGRPRRVAMRSYLFDHRNHSMTAVDC
jgi:hypothetical protein